MTFDPDDPRLTAFALGELEGDERASVEALLAESPEARRAVEEVRALSRLLTEQLRAEPSPGLSPEQRRVIAAELGRPTILRPFGRRWLTYGLAAAAAVLAGGTATIAWMNGLKPASDRVDLAVAAAPSPPVIRNSVVRSEEEAAPRSESPEADASDFSAALDSDNIPAPPAAAPRPEGLRSDPGPAGAVKLESFAAGTTAASGDKGMPLDGLAGEPGQVPPARPVTGSGGGLGGFMVPEGARQNGREAKPAPAEMFALRAPAESAPSPPAANRPEGFAGGMAGRDTMLGESLSKEESPSPPKDREQAEHKYREQDQSFDQPAPAEPRKPDALGIFPKQRQGGQQGQQGGQTGPDEYNRRGESPLTAGQKPGMSVAPPPSPASPSGGGQAAGERLRQLGRADSREESRARRVKEFADVGKPAGDQVSSLGDEKAKPGQAESLARSRGAAGLPAGDESPKGKALQEPQDRLQELQEVEAASKSRFALAPVVPADPEPAAIAAERFAPIEENAFEDVTPEHRLSTFSVDVDTASYANVRRYLNQGMLPPPDAVRIEEMVNYFAYDYPAPSPDAEVPFSVDCEAVRCPWQPDHTLLRIGLKGKEIDFSERKPSNLVFVVDVSGSMDEPDKLPLVKAGLRMLLEQLGENDKIAMVTYAGQASVALPPTRGHRKAEIASAIDQLTPGGSTHGSAGMELAYQMAVENLIPGGVNRVILATDGDFNVGVTGPDALTRLAEEKAKTGVFLNVLGVGQGNLKDESMEKMADKGNGSYHYLDSLMEARKVLVEQVGGTLVTIAKDVKLQLAFNPAKVGRFRLVGYENRRLADRDFADDTKDAGEIGSGHAVTALYELVPPAELAQAEPDRKAEPARRAADQPQDLKKAEMVGELLTVSLRYKTPDGQTSREISQTVPDDVRDLGRASSDTKFAAAVAEFGMLLRRSRHAGQATLDAVLELAQANLGPDPTGRRKEFVLLVEKAKALTPTPPPAAPAPAELPR